MSTRAKDPDRVTTGRIGAHKLHGLYSSKDLTRAAHAATWEKFKAEALAAAEARGEKLSPEELERRALSLRKSYMLAMAREREQRKKKKAAPSPAAASLSASGVTSTEARSPDGTNHDPAVPA